MGVADLLKNLGPLLRNTNIYGTALGHRIGVDGHVWLHQLAYHWAEDIVYHKNYQSLANEFVQQAQFVLGQGVDLLFVFDGDATPAKRCTDQHRQRRRAESYARVMHGGDAAPSKTAIQAAVSLGWPAVLAVISRLREQGIPYVVAPYEADSQLAMLSKIGAVWAVATVDADFIVHGIDRIFFRVSWDSGRAAMWDRQVAINWQSWPDQKTWKTQFLTAVAQCGLGFVTAYTLAVGCDYDTKVPGVGPKKALTSCLRVTETHGPEVFKDVQGSLSFLAEQLKMYHEGKLQPCFVNN